MPTVTNASRNARLVTTCDLYRSECHTIAAAIASISTRSTACEFSTFIACT